MDTNTSGKKWKRNMSAGFWNLQAMAYIAKAASQEINSQTKPAWRRAHHIIEFHQPRLCRFAVKLKRARAFLLCALLPSAQPRQLARTNGSVNNFGVRGRASGVPRDGLLFLLLG